MTVPERLVSGSRERAEKRLWATLAAAPTEEQATGLQGLVVVPVGKRLSGLDRLRRSPRDITARGVGKALERYEALNAFGGAAWNLSAIPPGRLQALVRFARAARAQAVSDLAGDRRLATLVAFAAVMPQVAADEAIEVFDLVMGDLIRSSSTKMTKRRLRTLKGLDAAAILLRQVWIAVRGTAAEPEGDIRAMLDAMDVGPFHSAADTVKLLAQEPDDGAEQMLAARYNTIARFLPDLLGTFEFESSPAGERVLDALAFVKSLKGRRRPIQAWEVPAKFLTTAWRRLVLPPPPMSVGSVGKRALIVASAEALRTALHRHEVYVDGLRKWGDPNARLLNDTAWEAARSRVCEELDLDPKPDTILAVWTDRLDAAHREFANGLAANPAVRIEQQNGRDRIILTGLERLDEPASLRELHREIEARLPAVDLPEMVLEVDSWVPYLGDFTHVSEANSRRSSSGCSGSWATSSPRGWPTPAARPCTARTWTPTAGRATRSPATRSASSRSPATGTTSCAWPAPSTRALSKPLRSCGSSPRAASPPRRARPSWQVQGLEDPPVVRERVAEPGGASVARQHADEVVAADLAGGQGPGHAQHVVPVCADAVEADGVAGGFLEGPVVGGGVGAPQAGVADVGDPRGELVAADREQPEHDVGVRGGVGDDGRWSSLRKLVGTARSLIGDLASRATCPARPPLCSVIFPSGPDRHRVW